MYSTRCTCTLVVRGWGTGTESWATAGNDKANKTAAIANNGMLRGMLKSPVIMNGRILEHLEGLYRSVGGWGFEDRGSRIEVRGWKFESASTTTDTRHTIIPVR
jgi:hypothetical protein